ncbi:MAG TPA: ribose 5-phosphate isomerase B [Candidatus Xenobia bacterium]
MACVIIGSDHGGFGLKQELVKFLTEAGHDVRDYGTHSADPVDYPDVALLVAEAVVSVPNAVGIVIDGAGIGSAITANKVAGIRAACCHDTFSARNSKEHNNANVLTLGGRVIGGGAAQEVAKVWLDAKFLGGRHQRRVDKMLDVERKYLRCSPPSPQGGAR